MFSLQKNFKKTNGILYNCHDSFCSDCFPYLLFQSLQSSSKNLNENFFQNPQAEFPCIICSIGKSTFLPCWQELLKDTKEINKTIYQADNFCFDCNEGFATIAQRVSSQCEENAIP